MSGRRRPCKKKRAQQAKSREERREEEIQERINQLIEEGKITPVEYEVEKVGEITQNEEGKWYVQVEWKPTNEQPLGVSNCVELLQETNYYEGKSEEFIKHDLLKKQRHNDGEKSDSEED